MIKLGHLEALEQNLNLQSVLKVSTARLSVYRGLENIIKFINLCKRYLTSKRVMKRNRYMQEISELETKMIIPKKYQILV